MKEWCLEIEIGIKERNGMGRKGLEMEVEMDRRDGLVDEGD